MSKIHSTSPKDKTVLLFPIVVLALLFIGMVVSVVQMRERQTVNSKAAGTSPTSSSAANDCSVSVNQMVTLTQEKKLFDDINTYRQSHNLKPLVWNDALKKAAAWMSNDMLTKATQSHIDSLNRNFDKRIADCGYPATPVVGENVDSGAPPDPVALLATWKHAMPFNTNLINAKFTDIGISLAQDASGKAFWAVEFAGPAPTPTPTLTPSPTLTPTLTPIPTLTPKPTATPKLSPIPPTTKPLSTTVPTRVPTIRFEPLPPSPTQKAPLPTMDPSWVANPDDMQIFVTVILPGIGYNEGNKSIKHLTRTVMVEVFDNTNASVVTGTGILKFDGTYFRGIIHLGKVKDDVYYIKAWAPKTLVTLITPQFQQLKSDRITILPEVVLLQGDMNEDNIIDIIDYNIALKCFQDAACPEKATIDFNDDGKTDIFDYNLLLNNYWKYLGD